MSFTVDFYKNNRENVKKLAGDSLVLIAGNSLMQRSADTHFAFRQDSNILYLTGVEEPNICLLLNPKENEEYILIDEKKGVAKIFDGTHNTAELIAKSGIKNIISISDGLDYIASHTELQTVLFNDVISWNKVDFTLNDFRKKIKRRLHARRIATAPAQPLLAQLRSVKQLQEIVAITNAVRFTQDALQLAQNTLPSAQTEHELQQIIDTHFIKNSVQHAYAPIIAAGNNAITLHYITNNANISEGDVVLFDVGAEVNNYAADISRTYVKGKNNRAQEVIAAVTQTQADLIAYIAPGITWKDLSAKTADVTAASLKKLGIVHTKEEVKAYMPHSVGHFLGLDVHDIGDYSAPLVENMVLTVEPGLYIPQENIGVRIEDDVIVTKTGAKILN